VDSVVFENDVIGTELPKVLIQATSKFQKTLQRLTTDEYGDLLYRGDDANDEQSKKVKDQGRLLTHYLGRLSNEHEGASRGEERVVVAEIGVQTEVELLEGMQDFLLMNLQTGAQRRV